MINPGFIKVVASIGKGLTVYAKGQSARIVAVAAAIGIVTISAAIAIGTYIVLKSLKSNNWKSPALSSKRISQLPI